MSFGDGKKCYCEAKICPELYQNPKVLSPIVSGNHSLNNGDVDSIPNAQYTTEVGQR